MAAELLLGRYRLAEAAGQGGFATVQVAWDTRLQRRVAVKRIALRDAAGSTAAAGLMEARTAALLSDEHIVKVLDFEATADEALIIMEHIDGPDLATLLRASDRLLDLPSVAAIAKDVGDALGCAHENQVLHLDIKPANILFDQKGHAKVTDFGMALLSARHGFGEPQGGTVGYMPPEQIEGLDVDQRTDLWALAVLLYQLLVGSNPYMADDAEESLQRIMTLSPPLPSQARDDLPPEADQPFILALSAEPRWRQADVEGFVGALLPFLGSTRTGHAALRRRVVALSEDDAAQAGQTARRDESRTAWRLPWGQTAPTRRREGTRPSGAPAAAGLGGRPPSAANGLEGDGSDLDDVPDIDVPDEAEPDDGRGLLLPWRRQSLRKQRAWARLLAALAAAALSFTGLSGFGLLGLGGGGVATGWEWHPVGGSAAAVTSDGEAALTVAEEQAQLAILAGALALVALAAFIAPPLGGALSVLVLSAGLLARGLVLVGLLSGLGGLLWWLLLGRRGWPESTLVTLSAPLAWAFAPAALPLLAGLYLRPLRAVGTALGGWLALLTLTALSLPLVPGPSPGGLLSAGLVLGRPTMQLPTELMRLLGSPEAWATLAAWLSAAALMAHLAKPSRAGLAEAWRAAQRRKADGATELEEALEVEGLYPSRLRLGLGAVLATVVLLAGLVAVPLLSAQPGAVGAAGLQAGRVGVSLGLVAGLVMTGVAPGRGSIDSLLDGDGEES